MSVVVDYRQGDRYPNLAVTLRDGVGAPIDLSLAQSVAFHMRKKGTVAAHINHAVTIVDPTAGQVRYDWQPGDLNEPGLYDADFEIDWGGSGTQTVPSRRGDFQISVSPELA